ncbi:MAG: nuclear transport factor 2 family protein, partial [Rhodococcus sp. (in: high G+C Gram-positive bacteria)]
MDLEAVAAISRLKYAYLRSLDTKCWDEFADTLLPDA